MKKAVTILLLILMVSIQTPVGQLFKLPLLIEHYLKHQKQEDISFISFLEVHYTSDHMDADFPEDEQLPFKNITFYSIGYAIVTSIVQGNMFAPLLNEKEIILPDIYIPQQHLGSIFHPPRM
jgi:hypothetical protein